MSEVLPPDSQIPVDISTLVANVNTLESLGPGVLIGGHNPANAQSIANGTLTNTFADFDDANSAGERVFPAVGVGSLSYITIGANQPGLYLCSFQTFWNGGSSDVNPEVNILGGPFVNGSFACSAYASTVFATRAFSVLLFLGPGSPQENISPYVYQGTGAAQTLTQWELSIVQISRGNY